MGMIFDALFQSQPRDLQEQVTRRPVDLPGFAAGTRVATPSGPVDVAALKVGDLVRTLDHGTAPLRRVERWTCSLWRTSPASRLIQVKAGSLGAGRPAVDLMLSANQCVMISDPGCVALFGTAEVLVPVGLLTGLRGISTVFNRFSTDYVTLVTEEHELLMADGLEVATPYPTPDLLGLLSPERTAPPPARPSVPRKSLDMLVALLELEHAMGDGPITMGRHGNYLYLVQDPQ
ncbi:Hint domain-containing protein [Pontivivens ytuae]|uniref:Hint domain-containing protein n=1 Tax=Pontivivens ytuae TaxID=2789856 RepID=A0A7S9QD96_9RHOB|nr:Hint domain-containing protein [Pontivivens ytuae]QPH54650.1 Hint domain-containing protein [Pontivivens ytuae]